MEHISTGVAVVGVFMGGVAVLVFGMAGWYAVLNKIDSSRNSQMAVRNKH